MLIKLKTYFFLFGFIILAPHTKAQNNGIIDSLIIVKDYIQTLQKNIPKNESEIIFTAKNLDSLAKLGNIYRAILEAQLNVVLQDSINIKNEQLRKFDFIIQSAILLKTDLNQELFETPQVKKEMQYLSKNCSILIDRIYFFFDFYIQKIEDNQH